MRANGFVGRAILPAAGFQPALVRDAAVVFTTRYRPVKGVRGFYCANIKHGVSPLESGARYTLGTIYHDAR
jgi:hypothetical protein